MTVQREVSPDKKGEIAANLDEKADLLDEIRGRVNVAMRSRPTCNTSRLLASGDPAEATSCQPETGNRLHFPPSAEDLWGGRRNLWAYICGVGCDCADTPSDGREGDDIGAIQRGPTEGESREEKGKERCERRELEDFAPTTTSSLRETFGTFASEDDGVDSREASAGQRALQRAIWESIVPRRNPRAAWPRQVSVLRA